MSWQVDADAAEEVRTLRANLSADRLTDSFFEIHVPCGAASHRHGERGRSSDDGPARAVAETQTGDAQAGDRTHHDRLGVVAAVHHLRHAGPKLRIAVE